MHKEDDACLVILSRIATRIGIKKFVANNAYKFNDSR